MFRPSQGPGLSFWCASILGNVFSEIVGMIELENAAERLRDINSYDKITIIQFNPTECNNTEQSVDIGKLISESGNNKRRVIMLILQVSYGDLIEQLISTLLMLRAGPEAMIIFTFQDWIKLLQHTPLSQ